MVGGFVVSRESVDAVLIAMVGAKIGAAPFVGSSLAGLAGLCPDRGWCCRRRHALGRLSPNNNSRLIRELFPVGALFMVTVFAQGK